MADLQLRFHNDMLVLSTPIGSQLERIGIDSVRDNELTLLLEPEVMSEIYALEAAAGAQCVVADTAFMTPARLTHSGMRESAAKLADSAIGVASEQNPQHLLIEVGPCGLPLDASSKASLNENRDQYARAAAMFAEFEPLFDAYFLNGFTSCTDLKCALMGMRKVTDKPILASVDLAATTGSFANAQTDATTEPLANADIRAAATPLADADQATTSETATWPERAPRVSQPFDYTLGGKGRETFAQAVAVMAEYGAQVAGFQVAAAPDTAASFVREAAEACFLPVLAQLAVGKIDPEQNAPTEQNPYYEPDTMIETADQIKAAGAQFLRAVGNATPSYTGALVAATIGDSVSRPKPFADASAAPSEDPAELAERLRSRVNAVLNN